MFAFGREFVIKQKPMNSFDNIIAILNTTTKANQTFIIISAVRPLFAGLDSISLVCDIRAQYLVVCRHCKVIMVTQLGSHSSSANDFYGLIMDSK